MILVKPDFTVLTSFKGLKHILAVKKNAKVKEDILKTEFISVYFVCDLETLQGLNKLKNTCFIDFPFTSGPDGLTFIIRPGSRIQPGEGTLCNFGLQTREDILWLNAIQNAEEIFYQMIQTGTHKEAYSILPQSLKAECMVTASLQEWQNIFEIGCHLSTNPKMRELMYPLRKEFRSKLPEIFVY